MANNVHQVIIRLRVSADKHIFKIAMKVQSMLASCQLSKWCARSNLGGCGGTRYIPLQIVTQRLQCSDIQRQNTRPENAGTGTWQAEL